MLPFVLSVGEFLSKVRYVKRIDGHGTRKQIWTVCPDCSLARWVYPNRSGVCRPCSARRKGKTQRVYGKRIVDNSTGYVRIRLFPDEPFGAMGGSNHWVLEHRLVMAKHLERELLASEIVHHLNGVRVDNRLENLALTKLKEHPHHTFTKAQAARIKELEDELSALRERCKPNTL